LGERRRRRTLSRDKLAATFVASASNLKAQSATLKEESNARNGLKRVSATVLQPIGIEDLDDEDDIMVPPKRNTARDFQVGLA
jgi:hypothetical protein